MKKSVLFFVFLIVVCVCFGGCRVEQKQAEQTQEPCPKTIEVPYMGKGVEFWWYITGENLPLYSENPNILNWAKGRILAKTADREGAMVNSEWNGGGKVDVPNGDWRWIFIRAKKDGVLLWDFEWRKK